MRQGRRVIILDRLSAGTVSILPVSNLRESERDALRSLLRLYLPSEKT